MQGLDDSVSRLSLLASVRASLLSAPSAPSENSDPNSGIIGAAENPTAKGLRSVESIIAELEVSPEEATPRLSPELTLTAPPPSRPLAPLRIESALSRP